MQIQTCIKGIRGESSPGAEDGLSWAQAKSMLTSGTGILSRWWQKKGEISPGEVQAVLTELNLERHLNDYATYGDNTPFISLAAGFVQRDPVAAVNHVYSALDVALEFATRFWRRPGVLFYCWTPVSTERAVEIEAVSEPVRDTLIYRSWYQYQHQGEITAKVSIPANQISRIEWWDGSVSHRGPVDTFINPSFVAPRPLTNMREYF